MGLREFGAGMMVRVRQAKTRQIGLGLTCFRRKVYKQAQRSTVVGRDDEE
jgi:hypothetical protein